VIIPVAVEKLAQREFSEIASRQEALGTIFRSLLDIFYHPDFGFLQKKRVFQQPPLLPTVTVSCAVAQKVLNSSERAHPTRVHCLSDVCRTHATGFL
jgi:hypothetical protein